MRGCTFAILAVGLGKRAQASDFRGGAVWLTGHCSPDFLRGCATQLRWASKQFVTTHPVLWFSLTRIIIVCFTESENMLVPIG